MNLGSHVSMSAVVPSGMFMVACSVFGWSAQALIGVWPFLILAAASWVEVASTWAYVVSPSLDGLCRIFSLQLVGSILHCAVIAVFQTSASWVVYIMRSLGFTAMASVKYRPK